MSFRLTHTKKKTLKSNIFKWTAKENVNHFKNTESIENADPKTGSKCAEFSVLTNKWMEINIDFISTSTPIRIVFIGICIGNWKDDTNISC